MLEPGELGLRSFSISLRKPQPDLLEFGFRPEPARLAPSAANPYDDSMLVPACRLTRRLSPPEPQTLFHCQRMLLRFLQHPSRLPAGRTTLLQPMPRGVPRNEKEALAY